MPRLAQSSSPNAIEYFTTTEATASHLMRSPRKLARTADGDGRARSDCRDRATRHPCRPRPHRGLDRLDDPSAYTSCGRRHPRKSFQIKKEDLLCRKLCGPLLRTVLMPMPPVPKLPPGLPAPQAAGAAAGNFRVAGQMDFGMAGPAHRASGRQGNTSASGPAADSARCRLLKANRVVIIPQPPIDRALRARTDRGV